MPPQLTCSTIGPVVSAVPTITLPLTTIRFETVAL